MPVQRRSKQLSSVAVWGDVLHDFGKTHRFVNTRNRKSKILHHATHHTVGIGCREFNWDGVFNRSRQHTLLDHFLDGTSRVDFHSVEIIEAIDFGSIFRELLTKSIGEIVGRIGRLKEVFVS